MAKYRNITETDLWLPGVGIVKAGAIVEVPGGMHNANFEKVQDDEPAAGPRRRAAHDSADQGE